MSIISEIQSELKAPKGQTNNFGKYKYRSCEDIVEAVKPLLVKHGCHLNITDDIISVSERVYVKATATIYMDDKVVSQSTACAREPLIKKGMDEAQITGATSSYARKYALNGLLAIDDTKDADTMDNRETVTYRFKKGEKEEVMQKVLVALSVGDEQAISSVLHEYDSPESKMAVWALFSSGERSAIKKLLQD